MHILYLNKLVRGMRRIRPPHQIHVKDCLIWDVTKKRTGPTECDVTQLHLRANDVRLTVWNKKTRYI